MSTSIKIISHLRRAVVRTDVLGKLVNFFVKMMSQNYQDTITTAATNGSNVHSNGDYPPITSSTSSGLRFNRGYLTSVPGILTVVALVCHLESFVLRRNTRICPWAQNLSLGDGKFGKASRKPLVLETCRRWFVVCSS